MSLKNDLQKKMKANNYTLHIMEADELIAVWRYKQSSRCMRSHNFSMVPQEWRYSAPPADGLACMPCHVTYRRNKSVGHSCIKPENGPDTTSTREIPDLTALDTVSFAKRNVAPFISPILDTRTLFLVCKDLGINGKVYTKVINGRQYIIIKGYAGLRKILVGTKYTINNHKIIQMAIGKTGLKNMVKGGGLLTICLTVPLTILECILKDQTTMSQIIPRIYSDLVKVGIGSLIGAIAGIAIGTIFTYAALPIIVAIGVGILVGKILEGIDKRYGLTEKLVAAFVKAEELTKAGQYRGQEAQFVGWNKMNLMRLH